MKFKFQEQVMTGKGRGKIVGYYDHDPTKPTTENWWSVEIDKTEYPYKEEDIRKLTLWEFIWNPKQKRIGNIAFVQMILIVIGWLVLITINFTKWYSLFTFIFSVSLPIIILIGLFSNYKRGPF